MPAPEIERRIELKFPIRRLSEDRLELLVRDHPLGFREEYPTRVIQNIYFDTPGLTCYRAAAQGWPRRVKMRLRWYGPESPSSGTLEWKWRDHAQGWKWSVPVTWSEPISQLRWSVLKTRLSAALPDDRRLLFGTLSDPVLCNRYTRRYLCSSDGVTRLTVDRDLAYVSQLGTGSPTLRGGILLRDLRILELKVPADHHAALGRIAGSFRLAPGAFSKYVHGVRLLLEADPRLY